MTAPKLEPVCQFRVELAPPQENGTRLTPQRCHDDVGVDSGAPYQGFH